MKKKILFASFFALFISLNFHAYANQTSGGSSGSINGHQQTWPPECPELWGDVEEHDCSADDSPISQECVDACAAFAEKCVDGEDSWTLSYSIRCAELH